MSRYHGRVSRSEKKQKFNLVLGNKKEEHCRIYTPKHTFSDFAIDDHIKKNIALHGYTIPTPIQDQAIPVLLEGKDVVGKARTGTGKTAAFLIPLIHALIIKKTKKVLIVAPTRELAAQIYEELSLFAEKTAITAVLCIGGISTKKQIDALREKPDFVIGTPGRLIDLDKKRSINFSEYSTVVLDEVDTMLDMGFIHAITHIMRKMPEKRQTVFFSATIPDALKPIMQQFLYKPVFIAIEEGKSAIEEKVIRVQRANKIEKLHDLLIAPGFTKVLIFLRTKAAADMLAKELVDRGFEIALIHGDKTQAQRKKALEYFKNGQVPILLATDVVARGIDIDEVTHVINYDMPQTAEEYTHRIGRTARANNSGTAITFIEE